MNKTLAIEIAIATLMVSAQTFAEEKFSVITDTAAIKWIDTGEPFPNTQIAIVDGDPSQPGPFILRFRCPNNYKIASHQHPATERVTVLEGTFHAGIGDRYDAAKLVAVRRGGFFHLPGNLAHFGMCEGTTVIEVHAMGPWGTSMLEGK